MNATDRKWSDLVARNLPLPGIDPGKAPHTRRDLPPQKSCDFGLFGNDAAQIDLVDYINARGK